MTRRFILFLLVLCLTIFTITPTFAYSPTAFNGGASSETFNLTLDLAVTQVEINAGSLEAAQSFDNVNPPFTAGVGEGINVEVTLGEPGDLPVDLLNVSSMHTLGDGPNPNTDSDAVGGINTILIDGGAASIDTRSLVTATGTDTTLNWLVEGLTIHGDILGATDLIVTGPLTGTSSTTLNAEGQLVSTAYSEIDDLSVEVPLGLGLEILSVDSISTTVSATSDGTETGAAAYANTEFLNLRILGQEIIDPESGTVIGLEVVGTTIGSVEIRPTEEATISGTQAGANTVALRVTILEVLGLMGATIDIGTTSAQAGLQSGFPTAVTVSHVELVPAATLPREAWFLGGFGILFLIGTLMIRRHR
jgi:hypothetical protein